MANRSSKTMALLAIAAWCVIALAGCSAPDDAGTGPLEPPAQAIQELLELRLERSADAAEYAEYFLDPAVARELAAADAETTLTAGPPIPKWKEPYVVEADNGTVEVVVVWIGDEEHPSWPAATVFAMEQEDGMWKAKDASTRPRLQDTPAREE